MFEFFNDEQRAAMAERLGLTLDQIYAKAEEMNDAAYERGAKLGSFAKCLMPPSGIPNSPEIAAVLCSAVAHQIIDVASKRNRPFSFDDVEIGYEIAGKLIGSYLRKLALERFPEMMGHSNAERD